MQVSGVPRSRHSTGNSADGDDFNVDDDHNTSTRLEDPNGGDHDDVDGFYDRPTVAGLTQRKDMSLGLEPMTSTRASTGTSSFGTSSALDSQTVSMDAINGNESTQSRYE